jgi:hypothetical protein
MQENVSFEMLGGGMMHSKESGVSHFLSKDDAECLALVRELLSYLPSNNQDDPPYVPPLDDPSAAARNWRRSCPPTRASPTTCAGDRQHRRRWRFFEVHELWAENMVVGFARLNGYVIGIVANQPMVLAGCIDIKAASRPRTSSASATPTTSPSSPAGCARLPARHQPGVRRHHPQRRAHDLRLQRGHRAQADGHPAQELRRRLLRDEQQGAARRPALRLAQRRDRGDGRGGRGQHPLPQAGVQRGRKTRRPSARNWWTTTRTSSTTPMSPRPAA